MGGPSFEVSVTWENRHPVLSIRGELDYGTASVLQNALRDVLQEGAEQITVDLSEVTFLDSEGVKVLLSAYRKLRDTGRTMDVRGCSRFVANVFEILGLSKYLQITIHDR